MIVSINKINDKYKSLNTDEEVLNIAEKLSNINMLMNLLCCFCCNCELCFAAMKTLVLGIGNTLLSDEGVGIHVLHALAEELPPSDDVELLDGGTLSFTLAGPIEEADALIVVDAANIKAEPGAWRQFDGEAMDAFLLGNRKSSVHEVGLTDLRAIAILAGHWPEKRAMLAIQPQVVDWGEHPTPAVAAAIPPVCAAIRTLIQEWNRAA